MVRLLGLVIVLSSLLAIGNAVNIYQRSTYFHSESRVNLDLLVQDLDRVEESRLRELARRLALMSQSDHGILKIITQEFRQAMLFLFVCLGLALVFLLYLLLRLARMEKASLLSSTD